jgi:hypothetical protein
MGDLDNMRQIKFSLLILTTILATSLSISADRASAQQTPVQLDLLGAGVQLFTNLINGDPAKTAAAAEVRKAEIAAKAEVEKERMRIEANKSTDTLTPVLNKWGVAKIPCGAGVVVINIGTDTVCIQPDGKTPSGYYTFDSAKQKLVRSNSNIAQSSTSTQSSGNTNTTTNVQTVQTIQNNDSQKFKINQTIGVTDSGQNSGF